MVDALVGWFSSRGKINLVLDLAGWWESLDFLEYILEFFEQRLGFHWDGGFGSVQDFFHTTEVVAVSFLVDKFLHLDGRNDFNSRLRDT